MKHNLKIISILVILFLLAQLIGLFVVNVYLAKELPYDIKRPEFNETTSLFSIIVSIFIVTVLAMLLLRFNAVKLWKIWFFFGVWFALLISFAAFTSELFAAGLAFLSAFFKIVRPSAIIHNLTELFIYGGLAAIFVPLLNVWTMIVLLILISVYDGIAVWKTKHMIKLAKFQSRIKIFTGLLIPYEKDKVAVLGGGDIGFSLFFAGVVMKSSGLLDALIVTLAVSIALLLLFLTAKKKKFYPAMPFLTAGALIGYLIVLII